MARGTVTGPGASPADPLDVAVVGGGIAGVYCAWRLIASEPGDSDLLRALVVRRGGRPGDVVACDGMSGGRRDALQCHAAIWRRTSRQGLNRGRPRRAIPRWGGNRDVHGEGSTGWPH